MVSFMWLRMCWACSWKSWLPAASSHLHSARKMQSMSSAGMEASSHLHNARHAGVLVAADNSRAFRRTAALDIRTGGSATRAVHLGQKKALWTICRQVQQACSTAAASLCCRQPAATASLSAVRPQATSLKPSCTWPHFSGHSGTVGAQ